MSSDDGWIIRRNFMGQIVLQHYFASAEDLPDVDYIGAMKFDSVEEAVLKYQELEDIAYPSEYRLTVQVAPLNKERELMEIEEYTRKSFTVKAVHVTVANIEEVAKWCGGVIKQRRFIKVPVEKPQNDRQTQAYIGDWVLESGKGFKVYTNAAFSRSFGKNGGKETDPGERGRNVFEENNQAFIDEAAGSPIAAGSSNPGGTTSV